MQWRHQSVRIALCYINKKGVEIGERQNRCRDDSDYVTICEEWSELFIWKNYFREMETSDWIIISHVDHLSMERSSDLMGWD